MTKHEVHHRVSMQTMAWGVLVLSILLVWFSAGDHPLYAPDEGRYATVSMHMVTEGDWLVPHFDGHAHLTKPPLTYWAQAVCLKWLGHHEYAVRAPSLIAASLSLGILFLAGWRLRGPRMAALTVGVASVMPLFLIVNRLAITDPLLNACWLGGLVFGWLAVKEGRWRWLILLWGCVAAGLMVKGPLAFAPVVLLLVWLIVGRNWLGIKRLHILYGLPLSLVPIVLWVWGVLQNYPGALDIWRQEMLDRVTGAPGGAHPEPLWFYLPVFVAGVFPITTMLPIPGHTWSWATIRKRLGGASPLSLWFWAAVLPFVFFTLMSGKLHSYLLPLCGPWAIIGASLLEECLRGGEGQRSHLIKLPEVVFTFMVSVLGITAGMVGAVLWMDREFLFAALAWIPSSLAAIWMWRNWKREPRIRGSALGVVWLTLVVAWIGVFEGEDEIRSRHSPATMVEWLRGYQSGRGQEDSPTILIYGYRNHTINFYLERELEHLYAPDDLRDALDRAEGERLVFADIPAWRGLEKQDPALAGSFEQIGTFLRWFERETLILRYRGELTSVGGDQKLRSVGDELGVAGGGAGP